MQAVLSLSVTLALVIAGIACSSTISRAANAQQAVSADKAAEADGWLTKGNVAYNAKDYDGAITCYKKAVELDPGFASAYYNLGIIYSEKGMLDDAIATYKKVLEVKPDYYVAHNNLATAYMQKGMLEEAIAELKMVLESKPDLPNAHFNLGECYFTKGDTTRAAEHYYKAGTLFVDRRDKEWAQKSYDSLKKTGAEKLEKSLLEKMNEKEKVGEGFLEQHIEIKRKDAK